MKIGNMGPNILKYMVFKICSSLCTFKTNAFYLKNALAKGYTRCVPKTRSSPLLDLKYNAVRLQWRLQSGMDCSEEWVSCWPSQMPVLLCSVQGCFCVAVAELSSSSRTNNPQSSNPLVSGPLCKKFASSCCPVNINKVGDFAEMKSTKLNATEQTNSLM